MRNFETKRDLILDATLRVTVKKGSSSFTIREVAAEAGVNIAAINYYFNSKIHLLEEMDRLFMDNFNAAFTILDSDMPTEQKLLEWLDDALEYAIHYPGIIYMLKDKFKTGLDTPEGVTMISELLRRVGQVKELFDEIAGLDGTGDEDMNLFGMFASSAVSPFVLVPLVLGEVQETMTSPQERRKYFQFLINHFKKK